MQVNPMIESIRKGLVNQQISKLNAMLKAKEEEQKSAESDEVTTKTTFNAQGEKVMVFLKGDTVVRTVKIDGGPSGGAQAISGEAQKYVDSGVAVVGGLMSLGV